MKIYAELYGDIQKLRTKSRSGNILDHYKNMTTNIAKALKVVAMPSVTETMKQAMPDYSNIGSTALEVLKAGDRPYRVNSGNISLRRS